jgi:hypothetical protein
MRKVESQIGSKYGKLTVISEHSKTRNSHYRYTCQCECGNTTNVLLTHLRQGNTKACSDCSLRIGDSHAQWNGVGEISGDFWANHIVRSANGNKGRRKEIELSIDKEYAWSLFLFQNRKCALTGTELKFPRVGKDRDYTASLDRIDSSVGYVHGNVQWVHKDINMMKRIYSQEYFIEMCKLVANNNTSI